ncbi:Hypothetical protein D9617_9g023530 [Elsinoe fawcettii]|nr:Hypothetical protein D9617_9g023530 [Elsinoe fawcettii]
MAPKNRVLIPIFPGFNTLDVNGPLEALSNSAIAPANIFEVVIATSQELTPAFESIKVARDVSIESLLDPGNEGLASFDILIVPGGPPNLVDTAMKDEAKSMQKLIDAFWTSRTSNADRKWLISICTGTAFLADCGLLGGLTVTSHWAFLETLQGICDDASTRHSIPKTNIVRKRWVDSGEDDQGRRLVTAGGVSCGIDCTLWLVSEVAGLEWAQKVAASMDYDWKYAAGVVTEGQILSK